MTRYVFSNGQVRVAEETLRQPAKRHHPLAPTVLFLITIPRHLRQSNQPELRKEQRHEQRQQGA